MSEVNTEAVDTVESSEPQQTAENTEVTNTEESNEAVKQPDPFEAYDKRIANLMKHETALRKQEANLNQRSESFERYNKIEELVKSDPLQALTELGLDLDTILSHSLDKAEEEHRDPRDAKIEQLEKQMTQWSEEKEKEEKAYQEQQIEQAEKAFVEERKSFFAENKANYPVVDKVAAGKPELLDTKVLEVAQAYLDEYGQPPTDKVIFDILEEAAKEEYGMFLNQESSPAEENSSPRGLEDFGPGDTPSDNELANLSDLDRIALAAQALKRKRV